MDLNLSMRFTSKNVQRTNEATGMYVADGMSIGYVAMMQAGITDQSLLHAEISYSQWQKESSLYPKLQAMIGATGGDPD